jgi:hypothetical protein
MNPMGVSFGQGWENTDLRANRILKLPKFQWGHPAENNVKLDQNVM